VIASNGIDDVLALTHQQMENVMKRYPVTMIVACLLLFSGICVLVATAQQQGTKDDEAAQIMALQKERIAALKELVEVCVAQYKMGTLAFDSVAAAQDELLCAQLDSTDKPEERVAILEKQLKLTKGVLDFIDVRLKAAFKVTTVDLLRAKSHYLEVQIKLLQERSKLKAAAK
jgi:hypothetical protein